MRLYPEQEIEGNKKLIVYRANNAGRGSDNITLMVVSHDTDRAGTVAAQKKQGGVFVQASTSGWNSNINLSRAICAILGISEAERKWLESAGRKTK